MCALVLFGQGAYLGTRITLWSEANGVWPVKVLATISLVAVIETIFLAIWMANAGQPTGAVSNIFIALLSLAMGLQMAAVRALGVPGVFTTVATFTLLAFAGDFAGSRPKAEAPRLAGTLIGLVAGAFAGGVLFVHAPSYAPVLPLAITVLAILGGMLLTREYPRATRSLAAQ